MLVSAFLNRKVYIYACLELIDMVRCEEFYSLYREQKNFCGLDSKTVARIDKYLDEMDYLREIAAKSEISTVIGAPIGDGSISESALRPLISIKDPTIHNYVAEQLVKLVAEKGDKKGKKSIIKSKEVQQIVDRCRNDAAMAEQEAKDKTITSIAVIPQPHTKRTIKEAQIFIAATIETLLEEGFILEQVFNFLMDEMNKHPEFKTVNNKDRQEAVMIKDVPVEPTLTKVKTAIERVVDTVAIPDNVTVPMEESINHIQEQQPKDIGVELVTESMLTTPEPKRGLSETDKKAKDEVCEKIRKWLASDPKLSARKIARKLSTSSHPYSHGTVEEYVREMGLEFWRKQKT